MSSSVVEKVRQLVGTARDGTVAVLGSGITGRAAAACFRRAKIPVTVFDEGKIPSSVTAELHAAGADTCAEFDAEKSPVLGKWSFALPSPGVDPKDTFARAFAERGIPFVAETDILAAYVAMPKVGVTGTNGKSTTTALIYEMLRRDRAGVELVGNIGRSFFELIDLDSPQKNGLLPVMIAELSSYQLEWATELTPDVGVWLNLSENHLERHGTLANYLAAKGKLFGRQGKGQWAVLNADDPLCQSMRENCAGEIAYFGVDLVSESGASIGLATGEITWRFDGMSKIFQTKDSALLGRHNLANIAAAIAAAKLAGASDLAVQSAINEFSPLEHRLERVGEFSGVLYLNDSKATTPAATATALLAIKDGGYLGKLRLLVGGQAKRAPWSDVAKLIEQDSMELVGFGADGARVISEIKSESCPVNAKTFTSLQDAVRYVRSVSQRDDIVLLSPGCASFDAYSGFEERGRDFKRLVIAE